MRFSVLQDNKLVIWDEENPENTAVVFEIHPEATEITEIKP